MGTCLAALPAPWRLTTQYAGLKNRARTGSASSKVHVASPVADAPIKSPRVLIWSQYLMGECDERPLGRIFQSAIRIALSPRTETASTPGKYRESNSYLRKPAGS